MAPELGGPASTPAVRIVAAIPTLFPNILYLAKRYHRHGEYAPEPTSHIEFRWRLRNLWRLRKVAYGHAQVSMPATSVNGAVILMAPT